MFISGQTLLALDEDPCDESRLDLQFTSFENIPIWNQAKSNLCYAFAATVLIDHYKMTELHVNEELTSPLGLAAQTVVYADDKNIRTTFWGGNLKQSVEVAGIEGSCSANDLKDYLGEEALEQSISDLRKFYRQGKNQPEAEIEALANEVIQYLSARNFIQRVELKNIILFLKLSEEQFLGKLISSLCVKKNMVSLPELKTKNRSSVYQGTTMGYQLNELLVIEQKPVALDFCADVVTNPNFATGYNTPCARHYAVAVGQRNNGGKCEILMRDSQCDVYNEIKEGRCKEGYYWILRKDIVGYIDNMSWL